MGESAENHLAAGSGAEHETERPRRSGSRFHEAEAEPRGVIVVSEDGVVAGMDPTAERLLRGSSELFVEYRRLRCRGDSALAVFRAIRVASRMPPQGEHRATFRFRGSPPLEVVVVPTPQRYRRTAHALLLVFACED